jgi:PAS domain-containing protein
MSEVTGTWCRIMGYEEAANGTDTQRNFMSRIHPDDLPILSKADADYRGKTERSIAEYRLQTKDGGWCWMRSDAVARTG